MTIAVTIKVHDGIVVASDSATTMKRQLNNGGEEIVNVYDNANKIFNLGKGLPIGAVTAGVGAIGHASIATLAKDLRKRLSGEDKDHLDWALSENTYTMSEVADKAARFLFDETWKSAYGDNTNIGLFNFWIFGFSAGAPLSELWKIDVLEGVCNGPRLVRSQDVSGIDWAGQTEAVSRLLLGYDPRLEPFLRSQGADDASVQTFFNVMDQHFQAPLYSDPMPIMDAIELAEFLVYVAKMFSRFNTGAATVGGPTEVAAITRHEGFKWVKRKHYFDVELNRETRYGD